MFCEKCGKPISPGAQFCPNCGAPVAAGVSAAASVTPAFSKPSALPPRKINESPVLVLQPVFVAWPTILAIIPIQLFLTVWAGGFCGGFSMLGLQGVQALLHIHLPIGSTFIFWGALAFFGVPIVAYMLKRRTYSTAEYRFYNDRLEYTSSAFGRAEKTIDYRSIMEVDLKIGPVQKEYNIGTLILSTPVSINIGNQTGSRTGGIKVPDIPDPQAAYERVRQLVKAAQVG
jgi:membrane protein YdbS with pleckstrin-like domain